MYKFDLIDPHFLPHCACEIELSINAGDLLTIVGENGVGKSTLANRIWRESGLQTVMVEQKLLDVFYDRSLKKIKSVYLESRRDEIDVDFFELIWSRFLLDKKESRFQSTLSGGEGQALKICLGLGIKAECFILDEPSQFLDVESKKILNSILVELLARRKTVILIEHDYDWVTAPNLFIELKVENGILRKAKSWST